MQKPCFTGGSPVTRRVLIMAGGTGGHIFPALAVAQELQSVGFLVRWLGAAGGMEARLVPAADIEMDAISVSGLRGKGVGTRLLGGLRLLVALAQVLGIMLRFRPDVVLGMGGFVSGPGGLVAWFLSRPLLIHEQNAIAGLTNRVLARLSCRVLTAFQGAFPGYKDAVLVGNPVRQEIVALVSPEERFSGRSGALRILVLGGSLGAQVFNESLPEIFGAMASDQLAVWHQTGRDRDTETRLAYVAQGMKANVMPFIDDMAAAYAWADLVICRAGALTLSELMVAGLGAVLVPYPYAVDDHQTVNAQRLLEQGAACLLPQGDGFAMRLSTLLKALLGDPVAVDRRMHLLAMALKARQMAVPDAAGRVAQACLEVAG